MVPSSCICRSVCDTQWFVYFSDSENRRSSSIECYYSKAGDDERGCQAQERLTTPRYLFRATAPAWFWRQAYKSYASFIRSQFNATSGIPSTVLCHNAGNRGMRNAAHSYKCRLYGDIPWGMRLSAQCAFQMVCVQTHRQVPKVAHFPQFA